MAEDAKDRKPAGAESPVRGARVGPLGERHARGVAKAVAIDSHTVAVLTSPKLGKVDLTSKWAKEMQRVVEAEMRARGLPVCTDVIGRMRRLVKDAYDYGEDAVMELAKRELGPYYEIFEKHFDDWLAVYTNIRESA